MKAGPGSHPAKKYMSLATNSCVHSECLRSSLKLQLRVPLCSPSSDPPVWHKPDGSPQQTEGAGAARLQSHIFLQAAAATDSEAALWISTEPPKKHTFMYTTQRGKKNKLDFVWNFKYLIDVFSYIQQQDTPFPHFVSSLSVSPGAQRQCRDGQLRWQPATPSPLWSMFLWWMYSHKTPEIKMRNRTAKNHV